MRGAGHRPGAGGDEAPAERADLHVLTKKKDSSFSVENTEKEQVRRRFAPAGARTAVPHREGPAEESFLVPRPSRAAPVFFQALAELSTEFRFRRLCQTATAIVLSPESGSNNQFGWSCVEMCRVVWCPQR